jgi:aconitase B
LKKIGAIFPPRHTPPKRLFGTNGISSPVCQITESGALPIEVDVSALKMGDVVDILPYEGKIVKNGETVAEFSLKSQFQCFARFGSQTATDNQVNTATSLHFVQQYL